MRERVFVFVCFQLCRMRTRNWPGIFAVENGLGVTLLQSD